ncbi:MAG: hypothetical protein HAW60_00720 [Bdellovibrionales bacterium]|nr:hypothetical protein [Bdellovibrionales bacterium]
MKSLLNAKGQATVEAVLMLILGVSMVLGLVAGLNTSFKVFTENYFGSYFLCLIKNGELPTLKYVYVKGVDPDNCSTKHKAFTLTEGWAKKSIGGGSGSGSSGSKNKSSAKKKSASSKHRIASSKSGFNNFSKKRFKSRRGISKGSGGAGSSGKNKKDKDGDGISGGASVGTYGKLSNGNDGGVRIIRIKRRSSGRGKGSHNLYKDPGDKKIKTSGSINKSSEAGYGQKNKTRLKIDRTVAKTKIKKEEGFKFNFSTVMRFLIIVSLIIVIIIVIGGQLLSISKSFD